MSRNVLGSILSDAVELAGNVTNPLDNYLLEPSWNYMTSTYSRFTISFWFSIIIHEVLSNSFMFRSLYCRLHILVFACQVSLLSSFHLCKNIRYRE